MIMLLLLWCCDSDYAEHIASNAPRSLTPGLTKNHSPEHPHPKTALSHAILHPLLCNMLLECRSQSSGTLQRSPEVHRCRSSEDTNKDQLEHCHDL
eukprot:sb/3479163/